ncbi:helix-turn-helix domain-containing protein [Flavobacterium laiguense]|uniref:DNA-binding protein n=1 Tax=Flavobacterium laiguense TaxID=2169409 RepID=A0A2U1JWB4_9FLAO|nr:XRE family transcriptional regulator [Flavobacterium laiguense]PWA09501.1 DNA-binding protein [Flavobacterium laiguense]
MEAIIGQRIRNSRIHKGLSLQEVADSIGVSKQMVNKYELGKSMPTSDKLIAISKLFNQKIDYFFRKSEVVIGEISFRKKSNFGVKKVNSLKEEIRIQIENYLFIENICNVSNAFENPLQDYAIQEEQDVKTAVNTLRNHWNIGQDAIHNIIELLEDNHIKVIEVDDDSKKFDGLATVIDGKYHIIVITKAMPIERKRFTLLHELGHLLLPIATLEEKQQEKLCNVFASEMLLSENNLITELGNQRSRITFEELKNVQEKYGMSISAIVYKLGETKIMSQERVKKFYQKLNFDAALKQSVELSRYDGQEHSIRYENLAYRAVSEELISMSKASSLLQISLDELNSKLTSNLR